MKRLQGSDWQEKKDYLELIDYIESEKGNYCCFYRDENGETYNHWLTNEEKKEFSTLKYMYPKRVSKEVKNIKELKEIIEEIRTYQF